jgi:glyoxylase-like metal-dependent hydrolase (beta-lactamase superfamily II)
MPSGPCWWAGEQGAVKTLEEFRAQQHNSTGAAGPLANAKGLLPSKGVSQVKYQMMFLTFGSAMIAGLAALAPVSNAQAQATPIRVNPLTGGVYWIEGGVGSNAGVVIGKDGVIVIDAKQTPESGKAVLAEVRKLTPKPVTHVILTHSNLDHVDGLAGFPKGLTIIAQENCKKEMEHPRSNPQNIDLHDYLPTKTVNKKESLKIDGARFELLHFAPAHTSGDLIIYLPDQRIAFTGDITVTRLPYPLIHLEDNGSSEGWLESMKGIIALNADTFVPGHGGVQTKAELQKRLADTAARREKIKELVAQGKSLDEIKGLLGEPVRPAAGGGQGFASFTEVVYKELSKN